MKFLFQSIVRPKAVWKRWGRSAYGVERPKFQSIVRPKAVWKTLAGGRHYFGKHSFNPSSAQRRSGSDSTNIRAGAAGLVSIHRPPKGGLEGVPGVYVIWTKNRFQSIVRPKAVWKGSFDLLSISPAYVSIHRPPKGGLEDHEQRQHGPHHTGFQSIVRPKAVWKQA